MPSGLPLKWEVSFLLIQADAASRRGLIQALGAMETDRDPNGGITQAESLGMFNTYSVEIRSKIDGLVKQVLFISAGVQAVTVGAFLSGTPPQLPANAIDLLKLG